jgi:hypothetical protein
VSTAHHSFRENAGARTPLRVTHEICAVSKGADSKRLKSLRLRVEMAVGKRMMQSRALSKRAHTRSQANEFGRADLRIGCRGYRRKLARSLRGMGQGPSVLEKAMTRGLPGERRR